MDYLLNGLRKITDKNEINKIERSINKKIGILSSDEYYILSREAFEYNGKIRTYLKMAPGSDKDGCVIVPIMDNKIMLLRHYRYPIDKVIWELPRGFGEPNLTVSENALKELFEESNLTAQKVSVLGRIVVDGGIMTTEPYVVAIEAACNNGMKANDQDEFILDIKWFTKNELFNMIKNGEITDSMTISALTIAWAKVVIE